MKAIKEAYIGYIQQDGSEAGIKLHTLKNVDPRNSYKIDYVRYIANAFNFVMGRVAYFSNYHNRPQNNVIITDTALAENIGCSVNHSSIVLNQVKELFGLEFKREKYRGGARNITINNQLIDFLNVYTEDQLTIFIEKYNLTDSKLITALQQVFKYRVWAIKDTQLNNEIKQAKKSFLLRFRNYLHAVTTSNKSVQARINYIVSNKHLLTERQLLQLESIIEMNNQGRLPHYWFSTLIRLEQKVSAHELGAKDKNNTQEPSLTNGNQTEGITQTEKSSTRVKQKNPEEDIPGLTPQELQEFQELWNKIAEENEVPRIEKLTEQRIQSINDKVKSYSKEKLIQAVQNINNLSHNSAKSKYTMTFERLMRDEVFIMTLESNSTVANDVVGSDWLEDYMNTL